MERKPRKLAIFGHTIVRLDGDFTRLAVKVFREGMILAILQPNGEVAIKGTGIWENPKHPIYQWHIAIALHGLKLVPLYVVTVARQKCEEYQRGIAVRQLYYDAKELGFVVTPKNGKR